MNFSSRNDYIFFKYYGTGKNSRFGYAVFDHFIVNLDNGIPNPFIKDENLLKECNWTQGMRVNSNEDIVLCNCIMITQVSYKDIYYSKLRSIDNLDFRKITYCIDKNSVVFDYLDDYEKLSTVLSYFEDYPIYYSMLLLKNKDNKTTLDIAMENNSTKIIDLILNHLLKLGGFSCSQMIYKEFSELFRMNLKSFEKYLNS